MSRSYKKCPGYKDHSEFFKNYANRVIRRKTFDIQSGGWYKRLFDRYSICDYKTIYHSRSELFREWDRDSREPHWNSWTGKLYAYEPEKRPWHYWMK